MNTPNAILFVGFDLLKLNYVLLPVELKCGFLKTQQWLSSFTMTKSLQRRQVRLLVSGGDFFFADMFHANEPPAAPGV